MPGSKEVGLCRRSLKQAVGAGRLVGGRYALLESLGSGGTAEVYLAIDRMVGAYRAVKCLSAGSDGAQTALREVLLLAQLNHPSIPRVVDQFRVDDVICVVMDWIEGETLENRIRCRGPAGESEWMRMAGQLTDVLTYLHSGRDCAPLIFADLKPSNILCSNSGRLTLIDFGQAIRCDESLPSDGKILTAGGVPKTAPSDGDRGTPGFAAPEQYPGSAAPVGFAADIYALGAVLLYLSTGCIWMRPTEPPAPAVLNRAHLTPELREIIRTAMSPDPGDRYPSASDLQTQIRVAAAEHRSTAVSIRSQLAVAAICLLLCALGLSSMAGSWATGSNARRAALDAAMEEAVTAVQRGAWPEAASAYWAACQAEPACEAAALGWLHCRLMAAREMGREQSPFDRPDPPSVHTLLAEARRRFLQSDRAPMKRSPAFLLAVARLALSTDDPADLVQAEQDLQRVLTLAAGPGTGAFEAADALARLSRFRMGTGVAGPGALPELESVLAALPAAAARSDLDAGTRAELLVLAAGAAAFEWEPDRSGLVNLDQYGRRLLTRVSEIHLSDAERQWTVRQICQAISDGMERCWLTAADFEADTLLLQWLDRCIRTGAADPVTCYMRAAAVFERRIPAGAAHTERAMRLYQKVLVIEPDHAAAAVHLAGVALQRAQALRQKWHTAAHPTPAHRDAAREAVWMSEQVWFYLSRLLAAQPDRLPAPLSEYLEDLRQKRIISRLGRPGQLEGGDGCTSQCSTSAVP